ncbi:MAG: general secretion pathway protein GspB [Noviherbaspirillum sp.]
MSYILEALRKAQSERARGAVPGVDAQPVPTIVERPPMGGVVWAAAGLALLALCAVLFWLRPWAGSEAGAPPPAARQPEAPAAQPAPVAAPPAPKIAAVPEAPPAPAPSRSVRRMGEAAPAETAPPAFAPVPERIALLQELPAQIQREIPPLAINGYIYASSPADRSVLINNRLRREGDQLADGLVLEKLLPREMVLNYRGYRYRISY